METRDEEWRRSDGKDMVSENGKYVWSNGDCKETSRKFPSSETSRKFPSSKTNPRFLSIYNNATSKKLKNNHINFLSTLLHFPLKNNK